MYFLYNTLLISFIVSFTLPNTLGKKTKNKAKRQRGVLS